MTFPRLFERFIDDEFMFKIIRYMNYILGWNQFYRI